MKTKAQRIKTKEEIENRLKTLNDFIENETKEIKKYSDLVEYECRNYDSIYSMSLAARILKDHSTRLHELCEERIELVEELERL